MEQAARTNLPLVDSHLDLADTVTLFGRDLTSSVAEIRKLENRGDKTGHGVPSRA